MSDIVPLVPSDVDLTDFPFMAVDVEKLLGSDTWLAAIDNKLIAWACINLWFKSWHQKPAASLPANDRQLARIAECEYEEFLTIKDVVMKRWVLCSDGRLYHRTVAEKALEAWISKLEQRKKGSSNIAKRWNKPFDPKEFDRMIEESKSLLASLNPLAKGLNKSGSYTASNTGSKTAGSSTGNTGSKKTDEKQAKDTAGITGSSSASNTDSNTGGILKGEGQEKGQGDLKPSCTEQGTSPSSAPAITPGEPSAENVDHPSSEVRPPFRLEQQELPVDDPVQPFILLPQNDGDEYPIFEVNITEFSELYPAVDVRQHLRNMRGWLISHKRQRKTKDGMLRFVTDWLKKEQDKGGPASATVAQRGSRMSSGKHSGFDQKDYGKGINQDGSF